METVPPTDVFEQSASIDLGDRTVRLDFLGRGHTDSDIVVTVPDADVTFAGDLVEEGAPPAFGDSFPVDWPETLVRMESMMGTVVVPGHGDVVDAAYVAGQRAELAAVATALIDSDGPEPPRGPYPPEVMAQALTRYRATRR